MVQVGVALPGTGGSYVSESWFGQWAPFQRHESSEVTATCINITNYEHDCMLTQLVIWSGRVGVANTNGANEYNGVHTWNLSAEQGGIGILLTQGKARIVNCYMDFAALVAENPTQLVVSNTLFLGAASVVLRPPSWDFATVNGLVVTGNSFSNKNASITVQDPSQHFHGVIDAGAWHIACTP